MIETDRLVLRPWRDDDRAAFAAINADPRVAVWLGGVRSPVETEAQIARIGRHIARHGYGFWAAERKADRRLVGMIGLKFNEETPPGPCVELGWRLAHDCWGQGLATEGARGAMAWGFANLDASEITAFTASDNRASQAVMTRIGMIHDPARDFEHPGLPAGHPLRPHVFFAA
ncbi:MAG TPA: GNAT family N-acetyltransferase, partial [Phenylobacterium sp.]|nr:GNAT family N-acetyltransferase [Phenylobacterium sp.]